jgi:hypothetical protein
LAAFAKPNLHDILMASRDPEIQKQKDINYLPGVFKRYNYSEREK